MKKILPIVIVAIVLLGAGAYLSLGKGEKKETLTVPTGKQTKTEKFSALKTAVKLGVPMKCSYSIEGTETEGYIKGEQWRGKIKSQDGKTSEVIIKDDCMWSWSEEQPQGIKMCFQTEEGEESVWDQENTDSDIEYNCTPTVISDDKFTPPSNIEFLDMNQGFDFEGFGTEE